MLISNDVVCGFAVVSTTTTNLQWVSLSTRLSSSPVQSPPFIAKSPTRSWSSSASGLVSGDHQSIITVASKGGAGSTFTTLPSSTVFSSLNNGFFLSSESSKASKQRDPFQSSERLVSSEILLAATTSRSSPKVESTSNGTLWELSPPSSPLTHIRLATMIPQYRVRAAAFAQRVSVQELHAHTHCLAPKRD